MPTVLITGANRGLGLEFVRQYAADNWHIIATCRAPNKAESLQKLAQQFSNIKIEQLDVADQKSIEQLTKRLRPTPIDILINNAGILSGSLNTSWQEGDASQSFGTIDPAAWEKVFRTNVIAPVLLSQHLMPNLKQGNLKKIIMISSRAGSITGMSSGGMIAYRTSKAALNAAMRNLHLSLSKDGMIIISLDPGWTKTDMGGTSADITPNDSVQGMRRVIDNLTPKQSGQFFRYNGDSVPW